VVMPLTACDEDKDPVGPEIPTIEAGCNMGGSFTVLWATVTPSSVLTYRVYKLGEKWGNVLNEGKTDLTDSFSAIIPHHRMKELEVEMIVEAPLADMKVVNWKKEKHGRQICTTKSETYIFERNSN